jgi:hypothetical protein
MKKVVRLMTVILVILFITVSIGCSRLVNLNLDAYKVTMTEKETTNTEAGEVNEIWINNNVGTITINKTDGKFVKVQMKKTVHGQDKKEVKEVISTITPKAEIVDGRLEIEAITREGKSDAWSWLSSNHNDINVNIDLYIDIPKSIKVYTIINVIGNIAINDITGSVNVENMTGNINLNNSMLNGDNRIILTTGNIDMKVNLNNANSLEATNSTGNVILEVPKTSKISLETSVITGAINGSFSGMVNKSGIGGIEWNGELNGGGKAVTLKSITGNVIVNSR